MFCSKFPKTGEANQQALNRLKRCLSDPLSDLLPSSFSMEAAGDTMDNQNNNAQYIEEIPCSKTATKVILASWSVLARAGPHGIVADRSFTSALLLASKYWIYHRKNDAPGRAVDINLGISSLQLSQGQVHLVKVSSEFAFGIAIICSDGGVSYTSLVVL